MFGTFDLETLGLGGKFINGGVFDGSNYYYFDNLSYLIEHLLSSPCHLYYAHNSGKYDTRYFISYFLKHGYLLKPLIMKDGSIIRLNVYKKNKKVLELRDSLSLLRSSLKNLTHSFNVKHKKLELDQDYEKMKITKQQKEYLQYDVLGLYEVLEEFFKIIITRNVKTALTISSCAMKDFKINYPLNYNKIKNIDNKILRSGYYGGRVEIFKTFFKSSTTDLKCYDVNSLYPYVMSDFKFPTGTYTVSKLPITTEYISLVEFDCPKSLNIPLLPIHYKGKLIFSTGYGKGVYSRHELEKALSLGYKIKYLKTYNFKSSDYLFKDFVSFWYDIKKKSTGSKRTIAKLMLNSLYGKFGTRSERQRYIINPDKKWIDKNFKKWSLNDYGNFEVWSNDFSFTMPYVNIPIVIYVTSLARLTLYKYIEKCNDVYYCDTDSVFTTTKLQTSKDLGAMKLEKQIKEGYFLRPKVYGLVDAENNQIIKAKGFKKEKINITAYRKAFNSMNYKGFSQNNKGIGGIKTTMKRFNSFICSYDQLKSIKTDYNKREILKNKIDTKPLFLTKETFKKGYST